MNIELFKNHQLFDKLEQLNQAINENSFRERADLENILFFESVHKYITDRIRLTLPILVQQNEIDALANEIDAGNQQINLFNANYNIGHLTNATNNLYSAINRIRNFPLPFSENTFDFSTSIANFQNVTQEKYELLENKNFELSRNIQTLSVTVTEKQDQILTLSKQLESKELEIQNLNSSFQTGFENIKSKSAQDLEIDRSTFRSEIDQDKKTFKEEFEKLKIDMTIDSAHTLQKLEQKLTDANKIVNVIGNVGVTGNYQLIANEHKSSANFWRWVAILFMASFSALLIWTIIDVSSSTFDWTKALIRVIAAAALSYPATYAARESTKHRKLETINRTAELELSSINPFIEILSDEKKQQIKEKLVDKYFGNSVVGTDLNPNDEGLSISAFEKIIEAVAKIKK